MLDTPQIRKIRVIVNGIPFVFDAGDFYHENYVHVKAIDTSEVLSGRNHISLEVETGERPVSRQPSPRRPNPHTK